MIDPDVVDLLAQLTDRLGSGELSGTTVELEAPLGGVKVVVGEHGSAKEAWDRVDWNHPDWVQRRGTPVCIRNPEGEHEVIGWMGVDGFVSKNPDVEP